jgi:O-succinylbenzoate synthase
VVPTRARHMIEIVSISLREIRLPLKEPFRISSGLTTERRIALLELRDGSGAVAWSECVAGELPNYSPETIDTAWLAITEWLAPRIMGRSIASPGDAFPILDEDIRGHLMAKAAIEMGIWGLEAVRLGMSLSQLIGGTRREIDVGISLGIQASPDALASRVTKALDEGYRKVKIKIMPGADIEFVRAARQAAGPTAPLMADANNAYTLDHADHLAQLDELNLMMIEQPLAHDDLVRHAELQKHLQTPICLDESITSLDRAQDMVTLGSGRIVNIKPGRVGGFAASVAIHDFCESNDIPVWCGGMLESGIGRAYNVALASLSNFGKPGDVSPSSRYWTKDIVTPEWKMTDRGTMVVPEGAGLGVDIDRDRIEDLTVRETTIS